MPIGRTPSLVVRILAPQWGDFGHMAFEVAPIADYLDDKEDSDLEYLVIVQP